RKAPGGLLGRMWSAFTIVKAAAKATRPEKPGPPDVRPRGARPKGPLAFDLVVKEPEESRPSTTGAASAAGCLLWGCNGTTRGILDQGQASRQFFMRTKLKFAQDSPVRAVYPHDSTGF